MDGGDRQVLVAVLGVVAAVVGLIAAAVGRKKEIIHRREPAPAPAAPPPPGTAGESRSACPECGGSEFRIWRGLRGFLPHVTLWTLLFSGVIGLLAYGFLFGGNHRRSPFATEAELKAVVLAVAGCGVIPGAVYFLARRKVLFGCKGCGSVWQRAELKP
jgi:hypothetical protein